MTPDRAFSIMIEHSAPSGAVIADAAPVLARLIAVHLLGGDDRVQDAIASLVLAQRSAVTRWFDLADKTADAISAEADPSDPRKGGTAGERALDAAFKRVLAAQSGSEQHREKILMLWRHTRKTLMPARAFVYYLSAALLPLKGVDPEGWSLDDLAHTPPGDMQNNVRASLQVAVLLRRAWDQRRASSVKTLLKPRRTAAG